MKTIGVNGRGERIRTSALYVQNVALYQAKLHPEIAGPTGQKTSLVAENAVFVTCAAFFAKPASITRKKLVAKRLTQALTDRLPNDDQ